MAQDTAGAAPGSEFFFKGESGRNTRGLLRLIILCTIAAAAISARLFSVIRFESIIHECELCPQRMQYMSASTDTYPSSRSVVQLPSNKVPRQQWLLQLLGLVRRPNMAPSRPCHWRYPLPRPDGHFRCHLPCPPRPLDARRHSQHLRVARSRLLGSHGFCNISSHLRDQR